MFEKTYSTISLYILCICMAGFFSCNKFLDKKITNGITSPQKLEDLQALLDNASGLNDNITPVFGEASSDDYFLNPDYRKVIDRTPLLKMVYIRQPYEYSFENDWSKGYLPVYNANYCLEMLRKIDAETSNADKWNNVYGSALFLRAYHFLMLTWNYAKAYDPETADKDLGIVLRLTSDFNVPSKRASVRESYEQILADAKESVRYLPDLPLHVYRPSRWAAYGLLARAYLSMRRYDSAYRYADLCLQIKSDLMDYNGDDDIADWENIYPFKQFNKETIYYTASNPWQVTILCSFPYALIDSVLTGYYEENDLRLKGYFFNIKGHYGFTGSYSQTPNNFTGIATDEVYLIRAECAARLNSTAIGLKEAVMDLNALLAKRYEAETFVPLSNSEQDPLLDRILLERRKELVCRGLRWMDIKRLNKEGRNIVLKRELDNVAYTVLPNANYYALPLPSDIIKIAGLEQNDQ
ncbi:RagB/SusD family nutrient uptake outer membrane protein [Niabella hirudinis]|uniref:RagB/SusD family nutrient uptake outer membrane protein n=1 Tax=Niabella hirudinis TaxID=1285929 RepID=UPI003EC10C6B